MLLPSLVLEVLPEQSKCSKHLTGFLWHYTKHPVLIVIDGCIKVDKKMSCLCLRNCRWQHNICIRLGKVADSVATSRVRSKWMLMHLVSEWWACRLCVDRYTGGAQWCWDRLSLQLRCCVLTPSSTSAYIFLISFSLID
jgi:hypothetical protein